MQIALKKEEKKKKKKKKETNIMYIYYLIVNDIFIKQSRISRSISRIGGKRCLLYLYFEIYDIAESLENTNTVILVQTPGNVIQWNERGLK